MFGIVTFARFEVVHARVFFGGGPSGSKAEADKDRAIEQREKNMNDFIF
ncbi:hypothetical protein [Rubritalea tangerina]